MAASRTYNGSGNNYRRGGSSGRGGSGGKWLFLAVVLAAVALIGWLYLRQDEKTVQRANTDKTVKVVLPPPPVTPPPPPEPKPEPKPEDPKPVPTPQPTPDPTPAPEKPAEATPSGDPTPGDDALTAREGAGPSNYGLGAGDGSGRIGGGGRPGGGGNAFAAYAGSIQGEIQAAIRRNPALHKRGLRAPVALTIGPDGRIVNVRLLQSTGDAAHDAALIASLNGLQLSRRPPEGLPVLRMEVRGQ